MKMTWKDGPLDGCVEDVARPTSVWIGPDLSEPKTKVVVYLWYSPTDYIFSQAVTDRANEWIQDHPEDADLT